MQLAKYQIAPGVEKAEQTSFNARLKAEQTYINNLEEMRQMVVQTPTSAVDRLEAEHNTRLLLLESYYKASLEYAKENGQDEKEVTDIYNQAKLSLHQKYQQDKLELVKNTENAIRALQGNSSLLLYAQVRLADFQYCYI